MYLRIILTVMLLMLACNTNKPTALEIHNNALVADMHSDTVLRMIEGFDFSKHDTTGHMDIPRLFKGGVDLQVFACWLDTKTPIEECRSTVDLLIDSLEAQIERNKDKIEICTTAKQAEDIIASGRVAAFLGIENGVAIANSIDSLKHFYDRGVRYLTLTHTASNDWCISSADTAPAFHGLTEFGIQVVSEMNEMGMIIDISHLHPWAVEEVLKNTKDPVIASHSCVHALCDHNRNLTDDQIKAIAENGGVIGINFYNGYLSQDWNEIADTLYSSKRPLIDSLRELYKDNDSLRNTKIRAIYKEVRQKLNDLTEINVKTVVNHIDHIVQLVGADYVGFGSDFDGIPSLPDGLTDCSMMPNITKELVNRGYAETDIKKILGENFMRVFREVCDN